MANQNGISYFTREFDLPTIGKTLTFYQSSIGDVGCIVWDAALVLAGFLEVLNAARPLRNLRVLELGAGTGCVGLAAAALGANVVLTDLPECVPQLEKNISANTSAVEERASVAELNWEMFETPTVVGSSYPDIILVADCIYYKEAIEPLAQTIEKLSCPETEVYLCYEDRDCDKNRALVREFMDKIQRNFNVSKISKDSYREDLACDDIYILKLKKK